LKTLDRLRMLIDRNGGFVNAHAHFDRAYTAQTIDFEKDTVNAHLFEKWEYVNAFKSQASEERYYNHISEAIYNQIQMGVSAGLTFIDCDPVSEDRALKAALRAKRDWHHKFELKIACQTLKGLEPWKDKSDARDYFYKFAHFFDIIGGLPRKDEGYEAEHIDILLQTAKLNHQRVHVHVDQLNCSSEKETELLARKTIEHGMEGRVTAVHSISLAAHPETYRKWYTGAERAMGMIVQVDVDFCLVLWEDGLDWEGKDEIKLAI
jgi:cytosine deaminase